MKEARGCRQSVMDLGIDLEAPIILVGRIFFLDSMLSYEEAWNISGSA